MVLLEEGIPIRRIPDRRGTPELRQQLERGSPFVSIQCITACLQFWNLKGWKLIVSSQVCRKFILWKT